MQESNLQPGSLVFCHSQGFIGKAIRLGEWLRFRKGDFYNHVAILKEPVGLKPKLINGTVVDWLVDDWIVIQAESRGVTETGLLSTVAPGGSYQVVKIPGADGRKVVAFAQSQVGSKYGWLSILSLALRILTPKWLMLPSLRSYRTWICSALGGEAVRYAGWLRDWPDVYAVTPSELYAAIQGMNIKEISAN